jgi:hypothetical protein
MVKGGVMASSEKFVITLATIMYFHHTQKTQHKFLLP